MTVCPYCKEQIITNSNEHIIPLAFGTNKTIPNINICKQCNNNYLSKLDNHFCSHSPIAIVLSKHLGKTYEFLYDTSNFLCRDIVDGFIDENNTFRVYPQIIFKENGS